MIYIELERRALLALCHWSAGTDLVVLTFQLLLDCETVTFFLCCFLSFILSLSVSIVFLDVFSLLFPVALTPPPPSRSPPAPEHSFDYSSFLAYAKSTGCFVVWTADNRLKGGKFLSTTFGKRTSSFPQKKKETTTTTTIKIGKQNRV